MSAAFSNNNQERSGRFAPAHAHEPVPTGGDAGSYEYATYPRQFLSYRWFKPILVALLALVFMLFFQIIAILGATIWSGDINFIDTVGNGYDDMNPYTGPGALAELGGIAVLLPALALAALIVRDRPFSSYSSSRGGWNWALFAKCLGVAAVVYALATVIEMFIPAAEGAVAADGVVRFTIEGVVACVFLIPLQCAAEEYVFRGLIMQAVGSWTKLPAVAILVSAVAFAAGHPYNVIGVVAIFLNGLIWGFVVWKTRGLEATTAIHVVNNTLAFVYGGLGLEATSSEVDVMSLVVAVAVDAIFAVAVIVLGKKFNWFKSTGDGTAEHNARVAAKRARKQALKEQRQVSAQPQGAQLSAAPQPPYAAQPAGAMQPPYAAQLPYD